MVIYNISGNKNHLYTAGMFALFAIPMLVLVVPNADAIDIPSMSQVSISDAVRAAFQSGLYLPLSVKNMDDQHDKNGQAVIGAATIALRNNNFVLLDIKVDDEKSSDNIVLSAQAKAQLHAAKGRALSKGGWLDISPDIRLHLNELTMHLELVINRAFFGVQHQQREEVLPAASVSNLSSLLQYDVNAYTSQSDGGYTHSAYLNFQDQTSLGDHHLAIEGGMATGDGGTQSVELNKLMYEHDANGRRFAAGMLDSWSMQELGSVSTLNNSRIYGFSYGNASQSLKVDSRQSLSPVVVYFPSAGEARIFRDNRLLSVQRVAMGNHELDTRDLPSGAYDVRVDVVIAGRVVSSRLQHVNKMGAGQQYSDGLAWQLWGGMFQRSSNYAALDEQQDNGFTPVGGVSLASYWKDINWNLSLYQTDHSSVEEGLASWQVTNQWRFDLQNLYSSDASNQWMVRTSYDLPDGVGSIWGYRQRGTDGDKLAFFAQSYDSAGLSLNLANWINNAGSLNISYEKDTKQHSQYVRTDYNQMVYSGRYGSAQLQLGMTGADFSSSDQQYYATLNFSLPLSADFQIGLSQQGSQRELDLQVGKSFEDSLVNYAGANLSTTMADGQQSSSFGAYADYAGRYGQGTVAMDGSQGSTSISLSNHGAFSLTGNGFAAGSGSGDAAVVVDVPEINRGDLEVVMDDQSYPLSSGRNLIAVSGYKNYQFSVRNSEHTKNSYQIMDDAHSYTLYPGNVAYLQPDIKQMVTVFGHLVDSLGMPLANARINNHIGITTSDENGNFAVDVDRHHPIIEIKSSSAQFNVSMNLNDADSTLWLGDVAWQQSNDAHSNKYKISQIMG